MWASAIALALFAGCAAPGAQTDGSTASPQAVHAAPERPAPASPQVVDAAPETPAAESSLFPRVAVETSEGTFVMKLNGEKAPISVLNFAEYVNSGFYVGTVVHRVVPGSVIQAGGYTPELAEKTEGLRPPIFHESYNGLRNRLWTVGMVRRPGVPNSATSQFYINLDDNVDLDIARDGAAYTVFAEVVEGIETVERIRRTPLGTHPNYAQGRSSVVPVTPVVIERVRFLTPLDRPAVEKLAADALRPPEERIAMIIANAESAAGSKAVTTESGLTYIDMNVGLGAAPVETDAVSAYYRGTLLDGREFESKMEEPTILDISLLIAGLKEGLTTMKEGGKRTLILPPELAFGSGGMPGFIPPNSTLVFEIELLKIMAPGSYFPQ